MLYDELIPQTRAEVASFVHAINEAAESENPELVAQHMENFAEFFAQAVEDGRRFGRMESLSFSRN